MYTIHTLNKISRTGLDLLNEHYTVSETLEGCDAILVRSAKMHDMVLPDSVKAVARAGAGVNNIPITEYANKGIAVFNTPGANANAVKELVIAGLLLSSRDVVSGINWAHTLESDVAKQVEKGKSAFAGQEIAGKTLGVIGLGAIGVMVANAASALGMKVIGYDPYISVEAAWGLASEVQHATTLDAVLMEADYITIHVPLLDSTKHMLNADAFNKMKDHVRILNFSRDTLVNNADLFAAIEAGKVAKYVTDFPVEDVMNDEHIITIPHLGASTVESEDNCAVMAVKEVRDYLENGNITNSVNLPACQMNWGTCYRLALIHKNEPNMIGQITNIIAESGINIQDMTNRSRGDFAYTLIDTDTAISEEQVNKLETIENMIKVRILKK